MNKQIIISIGRQYGSAGDKIAEILAAKFGIPVYNRNLLEEIARIKHIDTNDLEKYDEIPRNLFSSRKIKGYSNSPEENVAELQFALLRSRAADGDSFVVVGRCGDEIFHGEKCAVAVFIRGDKEDRIRRVMEIRGMNEKKALAAVERHDKKRKRYHDYFCTRYNWENCKNYDICVNSSKFGIEGTAEFLYEYISRYRENL